MGLRSERGASAVEFAIVSSVLLLLLFVIVQLAIMYHRRQSLEAAVREGARVASVGGSADEIAGRVRDTQSMFVPADVVVTTEPAAAGPITPCSVAGVGGTVTVRAAVLPNPAYQLAIPLWGSGTVTYASAGSFRCERTS